ncbi:MAG TPA: hypothetical protein VNB78_04295 [Sphingomicrobium sp.]|jgi:hypothetical protein|nr:hypothetical protein [Sphingomicrobium sp.]
MHALRTALDLRPRLSQAKAESRPPRLWNASDFRLFATTFLAGFIFVSILIG